MLYLNARYESASMQNLEQSEAYGRKADYEDSSTGDNNKCCGNISKAR